MKRKVEERQGKDALEAIELEVPGEYFQLVLEGRDSIKAVAVHKGKALPPEESAPTAKGRS